MRWFACLTLIAAGCSAGGGYIPRRDGGFQDFAGPHDMSFNNNSDMPRTASCSDGIQNGTETDIDCGGGSCAPCAAGRHCLSQTDCTTNSCVNGTCAAGTSCTNGIRDGSETDIDCGGPSCSPCPNGASCLQARDCQSFSCQNGFCANASSCSDGIQNGSETDIDCGGGTCPACSNGRRCNSSNDCQSFSCSSGLCCGSGTANCDGQSFNGCEVTLNSDPLNCGACFNNCNGLQCSNGNCVQGGNFTHADGFGDSWSDATPTGTYSQAEAMTACTTYVQKHGLAFACATDCGCNSGVDPCVYYKDTINTPFVWFYGTGTLKGETSANCCIDNASCLNSGSWN
jgi:hypothetical protein